MLFARSRVLTPAPLQAGESVYVSIVLACGLTIIIVFPKFPSVRLVVARTCELTASPVAPFGRARFVSDVTVPP